MAHTVVTDIFEPGTTVQEHNGVVQTLTRTFLVQGMNDATLVENRESNTTPSDRVGTDRVLITGSEVTDVPRLGEKHPDLGSLRVTSRSVRPTMGLSTAAGATEATPDSCFIDVNYERVARNNFDVKSHDVNLSYVLEMQETSKTHLGSEILVKGPASEDNSLNYGPKQRVLIPVLKPRLTASFRCLTFISSNLSAPQPGFETSILKYVRDRLARYNETKWMSFGDADSTPEHVGYPGTWLCVGIDTEFIGFNITEDGVLTDTKQYMCTFRFEHKSYSDDGQGWSVQHVYAEDPSHPGMRMYGVTPVNHGWDPDSGATSDVSSPTAQGVRYDQVDHVALCKMYGKYDFAAEFSEIVNL